MKSDDEAAPAVAGWMRLADEALGRAEPTAPDPMSVGAKTGQSGPVLVVEDDSDLRVTIAAALRDAGFAPVVEAPDGTAALAETQRRDPAVVVLDLALPGLDGARFADAYRRIPGSSGRIIVISGTDKGAETAARIRAEAFISKPLNVWNLVAVVHQCLAGGAGGSR